MLRTEGLLRLIAAIIVLLLGSVAVLAYANALLPGPPFLQTRMSHIVDLMTKGCGPAWHWSNRRGWNWGRCVRDRHP